MNKEQLDKQMNAGQYLIWAANRIKELEEANPTPEELMKLREDSHLLDCLKFTGVERWVGYEDAHNLYDSEV
jgi:hypothetical protein